MRVPRFKGIPRISTTQRTTEHRFEFSAADLRRLLRLPEEADLSVEQYDVREGIQQKAQALTLETGLAILVAKVTVTS